MSLELGLACSCFWKFTFGLARLPHIQNIQLLSCICITIRLMSYPAYVAADFNMIFAELADAGWLGSSVLVPLATDDVPTSYFRKPRAIDHIMCSNKLGAISSPAIVYASVRVTHLLFQFEIPSQPFMF